jgi:glutamine synthetase
VGEYAILKAGVDGIERRIDPGDPIPYNVYNLSRSEIEKKELRMLPENLRSAIEAFSSDGVVPQFFGECSKNLVQLKEREYESYENFVKKSWEESKSQITPWEIEQYLVRC